jgi:hypothetical protein
MYGNFLCNRKFKNVNDSAVHDRGELSRNFLEKVCHSTTSSRESSISYSFS